VFLDLNLNKDQQIIFFNKKKTDRPIDELLTLNLYAAGHLTPLFKIIVFGIRGETTIGPEEVFDPGKCELGRYQIMEV
jgi:hypothetical protein